MSIARLSVSVLAAFLAVRVFAQPLSDRLPESTLIYTGWSADGHFSDTRAGRMLADSRIAQPWRAVLQRIVLDLPDELAGSGQKISQHFPLLLSEASQCEGCFAVLELKHEDSGLVPQAVLLLNLGAHRKAFETHFEPIHARMKDRLGDRVHMLKLDNSWLWEKTTRDRAEYTWGFVGDWFVFYLGDGAETFLPTLSKKLDKSLKDSPAFRECLDKIPGESALTTYINLSGAMELLRSMLKTSTDDGLQLIADRWPKIVTELGFDNAKSIGEKTTVEGGQFVTRTLLRTDGPPRGLVAAMVQPAVDDSMLKGVPADAMFAMAIRADLTKCYDALKETTVNIAGEDGRKAFGDIEDAAAGFGVPVKTLLAPIGDQWVIYEAASTGGFAFTGLTVVVDVREPKQLGRTLLTLQALLSKEINNEAPAGIGQYVVDGATIHYVEPRGFALFTPAWAVEDNKLFIALYPQIVEDAVKQFKSDKSLLDNPAFAEARKQTGGGGPLLYISGTEFAKNIYPIVLPFISALKELSSTPEERTLPLAELLPSLQRLLNYVGVDVACVKLTPDGILRTKTVANPLLSPLSLTDVPLWVALTLPSMGQARVNADRVKSGSNLRQIGQCLTVYAVAHNDKLPPDLNTAIQGQNVPNDVLKSPFGKGNDYTYLYVAGMTTTKTTPDVPVAYDAAELARGDGASVLYADGHVEWLDQEGMKTALGKAAKWRDENGKK